MVKTADEGEDPAAATAATASITGMEAKHGTVSPTSARMKRMAALRKRQSSRNN